MISELLDNAKILCFKILYYEKLRIYYNNNFCMGKFGIFSDKQGNMVSVQLHRMFDLSQNSYIEDE